jgi:serine/threonine-protein kinase
MAAGGAAGVRHFCPAANPQICLSVTHFEEVKAIRYAEPASSIRYRVSGFHVDLGKRQVVGVDGRTLPLSSRAFDVLACLLENRNRVVTKAELLAAGWPGLVVGENNLNQAVSTLRRSLGDTRGEPGHIATIPGRGFRFIAEAKAEHGPSPPRSLAVLPVQPMDSGATEPAINLGIAEMLIHRLGAIAWLRIAPLSSVQHLVAAGTDSSSAGRALGVEAVLESHAWKANGQARLAARLIDVRDGTARWLDAFDESAEDLLALQERLSRRLVDVFAPDMPRELQQVLLRRPTSDDEAWRLHLTGRYHGDRRAPASLVRAMECYEAAIARDPDFAAPHAGIADIHALRGVLGVAPAHATFRAARSAALQALALDPRLADAHASLGHVAVQIDHDWQEGQRRYERALQLQPDYSQAHMWRAMLDAQLGNVTLGLQRTLQAQALEPMSLAYSSLAGMLMYLDADLSGAVRQLRRIVDAVPEASLARSFLAMPLLALREADEVIALLEGREEPGPRSFSSLTIAYVLADRREEALERTAQLRTLGEQGFGIGLDMALIQLALGDRQAALDWLERGVEDGSQMIGYLRSDPATEPLRGEPRFQAVVGRLFGT